MEIFRLFGSVLIDNDKANKSLDDTDKKAQGAGAKLGSMIGTAAKVGVGIAAGVAAGGAALFGLAKKAADATSEIKDMADRAGTSAEHFQKLKYAAEMSGMSIEGLEKAMIKQQKAFADANEGTKVQSEAYERLGIDIQKVGSSSEAFDLVIAKLADMKNETEKNALANDIFGKSYAELTPLLNEGGAGIEALKQKASDLGLVMSNESVAAGESFGDSLETLKQSFGMIATKIGVEVLPIIQKMVDFLMAHMPEIQAVTSKVFDAIGKAVTVASDVFSKYIMPTLQEFVVIISKVVDYIKVWLAENQDTVNSVKELYLSAFELIRTYVTNFITAVKVLWDKYGADIQRIAKTMWDYVGAIFKTTIDIITGIFKVFTALLKGDWQGAFNTMKDTTSKVFEDLKKVFSASFEVLKSVARLALDAIKNAFGNTFSGVGNTVRGIFTGIVDTIKNSINKMLSTLNWVISQINKIKIKIPEVDIPLIGKKGGGSIGLPSIKQIPLLANGGNVNDNGAFIAGEAGPELIAGMKGAKVTPLSKSGITLNFYDTKIMSDRDIDILGDRLTKRLKVLGV